MLLETLRRCHPALPCPTLPCPATSYCLLPHTGGGHRHLKRSEEDLGIPQLPVRLFFFFRPGSTCGFGSLAPVLLAFLQVRSPFLPPGIVVRYSNMCTVLYCTVLYCRFYFDVSPLPQRVLPPYWYIPSTSVPP